MKFLNTINNPADLKKLEPQELPQLASELRHLMIDAVSKTGGHLGAGLGVVELTIALHYIFDTPKDKLIWDVGHQSYPHKILTGRRDKIQTIRQKGGLSGFTKRSESIYDAFGAAHSSTSISAALGMAVARELSHQDHKILAVIGDGALSAGMAFEALNNAGAMKSPIIVILNDNDMSIAQPVGALSAYLSRLLSSKAYLKFRKFSIDILRKLPQPLEKKAKLADEFMRGMVQGGTLFEELGFFYIGLVDGHSFDQLLPVLNNLKNANLTGPVLLHVKTEKGKGYAPAEQSADKFHGVNKFDPITGEVHKTIANAPSYTKIFGEQLTKLAKQDSKIIGITAAMPSGTGLDIMQKSLPKQVFDVGIAEQHAVTFAAGMACEGLKPFVAIYSTFLQRAYDQLIHDVVYQNLPVRFCLDRAGLVGADGATHAGAYDLAYLCCLPNLVVMAPSDEMEMLRMVNTMAKYDKGPIAMRYPRGEAIGIDMADSDEIIEIGKSRVIRQGSKTAFFCLGPKIYDLCAIDFPYQPTIIDARFAKPIDEAMILQLCTTHDKIITIEEGSIGGMSAQVSEFLQKHHLCQKIQFESVYFPDILIDHANVGDQYHQAGFSAEKFISLLA